MDEENPVAKASLLTDAPLKRPQDDLLGRAEFARTLAQAIPRMPADNGFVLAVYGDWGSGKTTTLNFVQHYLEEQDAEKCPIIVRFNPWWFSGSEQILRAFFQHLGLTFRHNLSKKIAKDVGAALQRYLVPLERLAGMIPSPEGLIARLCLSAAILFGRALGQTEIDIQSARDSIDRLLRKQTRKVLVIMDDIDRLTAAEIRQTFQLVKAVADFPNTIYLLAFDHEVVREALKGVQEAPGQEYIEKIVQAPFNLPPADEYALQRLLFHHLRTILGESLPEDSDQDRWNEVFHKGIRTFIRTPRDVKRYVNILCLFWPVLQSEVNVIDFLGIEALRLFVPSIYTIVRNNKRLFTGASVDSLREDTNEEERKGLYEKFLQQIDKEEAKQPAEDLLRQLFPKFAAAFGGLGYASGWETTWRKEKRICSPDIFDTYFMFSVPEGVISAAEMQAILSLGSDGKALADELRRLADERGPGGYTSRARVFLGRIQDYTGEEIPLEHIQPILQALYDVGDELEQLNDSGFEPWTNDTYIMWITAQLLRRVETREGRFYILKSALSGAQSTYCVVSQVRWLENQHDEEAERVVPEDERTVAQEHLPDLREIALQKVRTGAQESSLRSVPRIGAVLLFWKQADGEQVVREYVADWISTDRGLVGFLENLAGVRYGLVPYTGPQPLINVDFVAGFVDDLDKVKGRVEDILESAPEWLSDNQASVLENLLKHLQLNNSSSP